MISFLLNNRQINLQEGKADTTLLNYLREELQLTGTKEGCASGDCGACTVVVAEVDAQGQGLEYRAINSCVTFLSALHGKQLITVEHLADNQTLHPVQQAMVDSNGSQCGFCTPGFVMSMFALYHSDQPINHQNVEIALSGNLCRCTGYRPIIEAAINSCQHKTPDQFTRSQAETIASLSELNKGEVNHPTLLVPTSREALRQDIQANPDARLVAGSTDLALEVTQSLKDIPTLISLSRVPELSRVENTDEGLVIGASVPLSDFEEALLSSFPQLSELLWRFASTPIRNQATLGGNVANASPIGDFPPVLLALNASVTLDDGTNRRTLPIEHFFTGYRQTELKPNEWVESICIPHLTEGSECRAYKVSKRLEDDISAVCAVFNVTLDDNKIVAINSGFGGVAATPVSATKLQSLVGMDWTSKATMQKGQEILRQSFTPIDDVRATAGYRVTLVANLWQRFWMQSSQQPVQTRVVQYA